MNRCTFALLCLARVGCASRGRAAGDPLDACARFLLAFHPAAAWRLSPHAATNRPAVSHSKSRVLSPRLEEKYGDVQEKYENFIKHVRENNIQLTEQQRKLCLLIEADQGFLQQKCNVDFTGDITPLEETIAGLEFRKRHRERQLEKKAQSGAAADILERARANLGRVDIGLGDSPGPAPIDYADIIAAATSGLPGAEVFAAAAPAPAPSPPPSPDFVSGASYADLAGAATSGGPPAPAPSPVASPGFVSGMSYADLAGAAKSGVPTAATPAPAPSPPAPPGFVSGMSYANLAGAPAAATPAPAPSPPAASGFVSGMSYADLLGAPAAATPAPAALPQEITRAPAERVSSAPVSAPADFGLPAQPMDPAKAQQWMVQRAEYEAACQLLMQRAEGGKLDDAEFKKLRSVLSSLMCTLVK